MESETLASIDEEINQHLVLVANLRARKNSFLPIFRLPPETLANIFTHGAHDHYLENGDLPLYPVLPCVNFSYVCRHWRAVALNYPSLWTYHFGASLRWTEELLARSKEASLKIFISQSSGLMWKLLGHAERIQELSLFISPTSPPPDHSLHAPRLQVLNIEGHWSHPIEWTLTIHDAPLRTLKLTDCSLPWHTLSLRGLTTLFLCRVSAPKQHIVGFLAMLNCMQNLRILHLDDVLTSARGFLSSGTFRVVSPQVNLPSLTRFLVIAPLLTVVALLSHVSIPLEAELRLGFQPEKQFSIEDYAHLPPLLAQRFVQSDDLSSTPTIRSLAIRSPQCEFILCASKRDDCNPHVSMGYPEWDSGIPLVISVETTTSMTRGKWDQITGDICCSIPLMAVQTLHVWDPPFSEEFWRKTFGRLHSLQKMNLSEGYMPNLVYLLSERVKTPKGHMTGDGDPAGSHAFVPALSKLELYRITFAFEGAFPLYGVSQTSLLDALATREELRSQLDMVACYVESSDSEESDPEEVSDHSSE